jgi:hypothetical protein
MPTNDSIRTVYVSVHLGDVPAFEIRADEDATATPAGCRFWGQGAGPGDRDLLLEVLDKIAAAYAATPTVALCVRGSQIRRQAECG